MSSRRDVRVSLFDIIENAHRVAAYTQGMDMHAFASDRMVIDAVERCIERVCEATVQLGEAAEALMPGHPWPAIRGMGNHLRHAYRTIEVAIVWEVATIRLPALTESAQAALDRLNAGQQETGEPCRDRKEGPT